MSRENALKQAEDFFDRGDFFNLLKHWITYRSESQNEKHPPGPGLPAGAYPVSQGLEAACRLLDNPGRPPPLLFAERIENPASPPSYLRPRRYRIGHGGPLAPGP
jgi:hypothetical protein